MNRSLEGKEKRRYPRVLGSNFRAVAEIVRKDGCSWDDWEGLSIWPRIYFTCSIRIA